MSSNQLTFDEPPSDYVDGLPEARRAEVLKIRQLQAQQKADLERVETWTWEQFTIAPGTTRRQREVVTVARHPSGWIANLGFDRQQACSTVFDYAKAGDLDEFRAFHETNPVIWRAVWGLKASGTSLCAYYCDQHLPAEYHPDTPREDPPPAKPRGEQDKQAEPSYYAVWGHYDRTGRPSQLHFWYRVQRGRSAGQIRSWPPRRNSFGVLYRSDIPSAEVCRDAFDCTPTEWRDRFWADVRDNRALARKEISELPEQAAARFAAYHSACCCCGRALTDERSKVYGVGPECRAGLPPEVLKRISEQTAREHAQTARDAP